MGKVASTSVYRSLCRAAVPWNVYHVHMLDKSHLKDREQMIKRSIFGKKNESAHLYQDLLWKPIWLNHKIGSAKEIKLVTMVREPIGRNISLFFQWTEFSESETNFNFVSRSRKFPFEISTPKNDLSPLFEYFINHFTHDSHIDWLNNELSKTFGFQLLNESFDREQGFAIYQSERAKLLLLKLEHLDKSFEEATSQFLGDGISLIKANEAKDKDIREIYLRFRNEIQLPQEYIDSVYNSEYVLHFYSQPEIDNFKEKWNPKTKIN